jgi:hypothetical protein
VIRIVKHNEAYTEINFQGRINENQSIALDVGKMIVDRRINPIPANIRLGSNVKYKIACHTHTISARRINDAISRLILGLSVLIIGIQRQRLE